jgi:LysR family transcriptional regulator, transcriptional activator of the cysJI operon
MLNLYKLQVFNTVASEGSFSRAARRLLLTQPAVSQHIRDLEAGLGVALFQRSQRGARLTPAGETLLDYTRRILSLLSEAEAAVISLGQAARGPLNLGATPGVGIYLLPRWIQTFRQSFPEVAISLRTGTTTELAGEIASGQIDLGFVEGEIAAQPPLKVLVLREIELCVVVGAVHPWWEAQEIALHDLDGQAFIARPAGSHTRAWTDQLFSHYGVAPRIVAEFDNPESIKQAVAAGMGISILPDWAFTAASAEVRGVPIQGFDLRRTLKLLWSGAAPPGPAQRAFIAHLRDQFPALAV